MKHFRSIFWSLFAITLAWAWTSDQHWFSEWVSLSGVLVLIVAFGVFGWAVLKVENHGKDKS